jgi:hypothetical protein
MKHKNDYSCIAFFENGKPKKWLYVHKLDGFVNFLNQKHQGWKYLNVYERRTGNFLKRFYPGNIVPGFLCLLLWVFTFFSPALSKPAIPLNSTFGKTTFSVNPYPMTFSKPTFINGFNNTATIPTTNGNQKGDILWHS